MNWELVSAVCAAVCSLLGVAGTLLIQAHAQGKQTQLVADLKETVSETKDRVEAHSGQLTRHEKEIGQLQTAVWPESWHRV